MEHTFLTVLGMSGTASVVIAAVLLARLILRKAPKVFSYALWAVVLFRLLCPFVIQSPWSLTPSIQVEHIVEHTSEWLPAVTVSTDRMEVVIRVDDSPAGRPESAPSDVPAGPSDHPDAAVQPPSFLAVAAAVWMTGAALLLGYSLVSLLVLRRRLVGSVPLEGEKNVRVADHIPSPFVLGVLRPRIYLLSGLTESERDYILLHERTHIRRFDHVFRALAWLALSIHWFNPLVWLAFRLAGRDMEMSCDEAVLRKMDRDIRADYSTSLLRLSTGKRLPAGPLAFGAGDPQRRIKNVLGYKKPALWVIAAATIVVMCAGAALATNPGSGRDAPEPDDGLSYAFNDDRTAVLITGGRAENLQWFPPGQSDFIDGAFPQGMMSFGELTLSNGWDFSGMAFWAGYNRNAVKLELIRAPAILDYTIWLEGSYSPEQAIIEGKISGDEGVEPNLSDEEVVELAKQLAYYLQAAESWYLQQQGPSAGLAADLTLSLDETGGDAGTVVRIDGAVGDVALSRGAFWYPDAAWGEHPLGELSMMYPAFTDGIEGHVTAWWADESRTAVTLSTHMTAMLSSQFNVGWWELTVDPGSGTVIARNGRSFREGYPDGETRFYPESITDEEAVKAARVAAKLMTEAEEFYRNAR